MRLLDAGLSGRATVVVELLLGIVLGPRVLGLHVSQLISFFSDLGLGLLFFFAGYEIDLRRIAGRPLSLGLAGWAISLVIAYAIGGVLAAAGIVLSLLYTGSALSTTAIGTLIPILSDAGDLRSRFGSYLLAAGAVGELGPMVLAITALATSSGHMRASAAAALVGAAVLSTLVFPLFGLRLRAAAVREAGVSEPLAADA
jgi:Kef-type K+ transport system membrane component KefB